MLFAWNMLFLLLNWQQLNHVPKQSAIIRSLLQQGSPLILMSNHRQLIQESQDGVKHRSDICYQLLSWNMAQKQLKAILGRLIQEDIQAHQFPVTYPHHWLYVTFSRETWAKDALPRVRSKIPAAYIRKKSDQEWWIPLGTYRNAADARYVTDQISALDYQVYSEVKLQQHYAIHIRHAEDAARLRHLLQHQGFMQRLRMLAPELQLIEADCS